MVNGSELNELLKRLEEQLLTPEVRQSASKLGSLLSDDFIEIGSSGVAYTKPQVIDALSKETGELRFSIEDFRSKVLAPGLALVTYRLTEGHINNENCSSSLRSSIWRLQEGSWQIVFHQGTKSLV